MLKNKIKVITYLRVACKEQETIFKKNEMLRDLLDKHKDEWEVVDNAFDYGFSGRKLERPGLLHVLEMCKNKKVDMVVTIDANMLARDVLLYKRIYQEFAENSIELYIDELHSSRHKINENLPLSDLYFQNNTSKLVYV